MSEVRDYSIVMRKLRRFFEDRGWCELDTHGRLSILSVGTNTNTFCTYNYGGEVWPLPYTAQRWLEKELLLNPDVPGVFCVGTSYRGDTIVPVLEFEMRGDGKELVILEELLVYLGFGGITAQVDSGVVEFMENTRTLGWNIKQSDDPDRIRNVDIRLHGEETITAAEHATNKEEMREEFYKISGGDYAKSLFSNFTNDRVVKELERFLTYDMVERCGGSMDVNRMIRAMRMSNILYDVVVEEVMVEENVEENVEEEILKYVSTKKSRCWGLPVAAKKTGGAVGSLLAGALVSGGENMIEMAVNSI